MFLRKKLLLGIAARLELSKLSGNNHVRSANDESGRLMTLITSLATEKSLAALNKQAASVQNRISRAAPVARDTGEFFFRVDYFRFDDNPLFTGYSTECSQKVVNSDIVMTPPN